MQALAERLDALVGGSVVAGLDPIQFAALKTYEPPPDSLVGRRLEGWGRRGKYLVGQHEGGLRLLMHLSQGGRVEIQDPPKTSRPKHGVVRLRYEDRPALPGQGVRHRAQGGLVGAGRR